MNKATFGVIGGGWRAEFYLRVAQALPERFEVGGMLVRDAEKGAALEQRRGVATRRTLDALLSNDLHFVVLCVPAAATPSLLHELADRGIPVLTETPPAPDLDGLLGLEELTRGGARIQVAEQYAFQPLHAARLAVVASGRLGAITQVQVSVAHAYHGISLLRKFLGIRFENARVTASNFSLPIVRGPGRGGPPSSEETVQSIQTIAQLDFDGRLGIYDFALEQYFSWIRAPHLLVRGERGEISDSRVCYLRDFRTPVTFDLLRQDAGEDGNLEGFYHKGILAGSEWVYLNPFVPARLSDDEIAVATCLEKMACYAEGGPEFYSLAEASQDHYLALISEHSAASAETFDTAAQPWAPNQAS